MLTGENGIIAQAKNAKTKTREAEEKEKANLDKQNQYIENFIGGNNNSSSGLKPGNTSTKTEENNYIDKNGNKATIPKVLKYQIKMEKLL